MSPQTPHPGLPDLSSVADRLAISDVIATYCRGIDRLDRDLVSSCFHDDATDEHGSFRGSITEFLDWAFDLLSKYDATMHFVGTHTATISGSVAVAETYGIAFHRSTDATPRRNLTVGFRYLDRFERRDAGPWLIARRIATTEWVTAPAPGSEWPIPRDSAVGTRDGADPLHRLLEELTHD